MEIDGKNDEGGEEKVGNGISVRVRGRWLTELHVE